MGYFKKNNWGTKVLKGIVIPDKEKTIILIMFGA